MWLDLLRRAATSTFEDAAFCLVEGFEEAGAEVGPARSAVRFHGPRSGLLMVEAEPATASAAAANMLGLDEEPTEELRGDAMREVANMICGQVVSGAGAEAGLFQLRPVPAEAPAGGTPEAEVVLALDCGRARVALWLEPEGSGGAG